MLLIRIVFIRYIDEQLQIGTTEIYNPRHMFLERNRWIDLQTLINGA